MGKRKRSFFYCLAFVTIALFGFTFVSSIAYADTIIDNDGPGTSYSGGQWGYSSGANPFGGSSRAESVSGATYTFQSSVSGSQQVSLWWTYWSSRCTSVPVAIYDGTTLLDTVHINQHQLGLAGQWNVLGSYSFGSSARVVIRAQNGCSACADAVRLVAEAPPVMVDVPNVIGLSQSDAETTVTGANLLVGDVTSASSSTVPEGNVISQTPTGGTSVAEGSVVDLVVSIGEQSEVVIDNDGPGTSSSGGDWGYSSGANPYGGSSRAESVSGATYTFQSSVSGSQQVSLWWTYWSSRCTSVPVAIYDGTTLLDTVHVNQQQQSLAGQWNVLGSYSFGSSARVVIRAQNGCSACADAVRLVAEAPPVMVDVPNVIGLSQSDAETTVTGANLLVGDVTSASSSTVPEGNVISQTPTGGTSVAQGSAVDLVVSIGEQSQVVIDNDGPGTSFSGGDWGYSSGANYYGSRSRAESVSGATYTFQGSVAGYQQVSLWWTYWSSRCTAVPVDIYNGTTLLDTVQVNQQQQNLAGRWNVLGPYVFSGTARIVVRAKNGCSADADAVKFEPIQGNPPIIIDNHDSQTSHTGTWSVSGGPNPYDPIDPNADSVFSRDGTTFTWHFSPPQSGVYDVSMWWTTYASRSTDIPVEIEHEGGTDTVYINQQENGGQWNSQGRFYFQTGTTYDITITSQSSPTSTCADAVKFSYISGGPYVDISEPSSYYLQTSPDLIVKANAYNLESTWKIKFVMDLGTPNERSIIAPSAPYSALFTGVTKKEHTVDAFIIDGSNSEVSGTYAHSHIIHVGIGNYYVAVGDSITQGYGDDDPSDDISLDGRNAGGGYEPILNNLLTSATGIPHTIVNEGVGGLTSLDGTGVISGDLSRHPDSQRFLVQYGTNDSDPYFPIPSGKGLSPGDSGYPGTYKENMQIIIDAINADGKEVCLSKLPITLGDTPTSTEYANPDLGRRSVLTKEYNDVIDELKDDPLNHITVIPPDLYSLFNQDVTGGKRYDFEYWDNLHPNGTGYRSMANQWLESIAP